MEAGKARTFTVGVTNTAAAGGTVWQTSGTGRVVVRARFGGASPTPYVYTDLAGPVAPGGTGVSQLLPLKAPVTGGNAPIELALLLGGANAPFATESVTVGLHPAVQGTIDASGVTALWPPDRPQTFAVGITNTALSDGATWNSSGAGRVVLRARFGGASPLPYQYLELPLPVAPGNSGAVDVTLTAPTAVGPATVELALLASGAITPFATATADVTVSSPLQGTLDLSGVAPLWTRGRTPSVTVGITNTAPSGGTTWTNSGTGRIVLSAQTGGMPVEYFSLPVGSVAPGATANFTSLALRAPSASGQVTLRFGLHIAGQTAPFASATVAVTVKEPVDGALDTASVPVPQAFTAGKPGVVTVTLVNNAAPDGNAWTQHPAASNETRIILRTRFGGAAPTPYVYTEAGVLATGGASAVASVAVTAPATVGTSSLEFALLVAGSGTPFAAASVPVEVVPALHGSVESSGVPASWVAGRDYTMDVPVQNTALGDGATWGSSGSGRVVLRARIGSLPYRYAELPHDVTPESGTSVSVTLCAPAAGPTPVERRCWWLARRRRWRRPALPPPRQRRCRGASLPGMCPVRHRGGDQHGAGRRHDVAGGGSGPGAAAGAGWLERHPAREQIVRRYLRHKGRLTRVALARLAEDDPDPDETTERWGQEEDTLEQPIRLGELRMGAVLAALKQSGAKRVLDLGCGEGRLLEILLKDRTFERITGMDVSYRSLEIAKDRLYLDRLPPKQRERITLLHGSLMYRDARLAGYDAAAVVEVIEHLDEPRLAAFERVVFECARPVTVVLTTPNAEYNVRWESLPAGKFRHRDHRFEWTRDEFSGWASAVAARFGYVVRFLAIGPNDPDVGPPTQMGVFTLAEPE